MAKKAARTHQTPIPSIEAAHDREPFDTPRPQVRGAASNRAPLVLAADSIRIALGRRELTGSESSGLGSVSSLPRLGRSSLRLLRFT